MLSRTICKRKLFLERQASDPAVENDVFFGRGGLVLKKQAFSTAASDPAVENMFPGPCRENF